MERKQHIVALPLSGEGHVSPMMHLCGYLAEHGFSVTFILNVDGPVQKSQELIKLKGTWPPPGVDVTFKELHIDAPFAQEALEKMDLAAIYEYSLRYRENLENTLREFNDISCLICDYQLAWAIDVARQMGIPGAILFTGSATWGWFEHNMPQLVSAGLVPMQQACYDLPEKEDKIVLEQPTLFRSDIPWHFWNDRKWQEYTIKWNSSVFEKADWVLVSSCEEIERDMVKVMKTTLGEKYLPIGPLFLFNEQPSAVGFQVCDNRCLEWLDRQPPLSVLYISFGSIAKLSEEQTEEFVMGLEASNQRFLWVVRSKIAQNALAFHEMLSETSGIFKQFVERTKNRGLLVSWAPQTQVLSHCSVGAFLSHCGWNSTIEALSNGRPVLCWPCLFEQGLNRRLVQDYWKVGTGFRKEPGSNVVKRGEVERVIRLVMENENEAGKLMRQRAEVLSLALRKAVRPGGQSDVNIQLFRDALKC